MNLDNFYFKLFSFLNILIRLNNLNLLHFLIFEYKIIKKNLKWWV